MEKQELEEWKITKNNYILSFGGASKGNLGAAGGEGISVSPTELINISFTWGLGIETSNRAEALALWKGISQAITHNVWNLVILGDSRLIIQALILRTKFRNEKLQHILDKIQLLLGKLCTY
jgi:ribonuclease HI